jgi:hypothetical protein
MKKEDEQSYFAFISYSHDDKKQAKWLQKEIRDFHLPAELANNNKELPRNPRKVCRDEDCFNGQNYEKQRINSLRNSINLVVVCSPQAADSREVNNEIKEFVEIGHEKRVDIDKHVFAFVINGKPYAKNDIDKECYPKQLKSCNPIAGKVLEEGKDKAFARIMSGMLDVPLEMIWDQYQIDKKKEKRKKIIVSVLSAVVFLSLALITIFTYNKHLINRSKLVAEKAELLVEEGDSYLAQLMLLEVLPDGKINNRPYSLEAELALRKALKKNSKKLPYSDIAYFNVQFTPDDRYVIGMTQDDTVYVWRTDNGQLIKKFYLDNYTPSHYGSDNIKDIYFMSDSRFFFVDSVAHVWDIHSGKNVANMNTKLAFDNVKRRKYKSYRLDNNKNNAIWDKNLHGSEYIKQMKDHSLAVIDVSGNIKERIPITNPLYATFTDDEDEILIIQQGHIIHWSRSNQQILSDIDFVSDDIYQLYGDGIYDSIYFSKDKTKLVLYILGGRADLDECWALLDLTNYSGPKLSCSPIEFSNDGTMCLRDTSTSGFDNPIYYIEGFTKDDDSYTKLKYAFADVDARLWDWKGKYMDQLVFLYKDTTFFIDEASFSVIRKDVNNICIGQSVNQQYYIAKDRSNLIKIYKNNKCQKVISLCGANMVHSADISSDGKILFTRSDSIAVTKDKTGLRKQIRVGVFRVWDIHSKYAKLLHEFSINDGDEDYILCPNGQYVISTSGELLNINNKTIQRLQGVNRMQGWNVLGACCSQDSKYIAIWNDIEVAIWDVDTKRLMWKIVLTHPNFPIYEAIFNHNGKELLVSFRYGAIIVDAMTGCEKERIDVEECWGAIYSDKDNQIILRDGEGSFFTYNHPTLNEIISMAKNNLKGRKLTREERRKYGLDVTSFKRN